MVMEPDIVLILPLRDLLVKTSAGNGTNERDSIFQGFADGRAFKNSSDVLYGGIVFSDGSPEIPDFAFPGLVLFKTRHIPQESFPHGVDRGLFDRSSFKRILPVPGQKGLF